jgi:hypothetical protein
VAAKLARQMLRSDQKIGVSKLGSKKRFTFNFVERIKSLTHSSKGEQ